MEEEEEETWVGPGILEWMRWKTGIHARGMGRVERRARRGVMRGRD